MPSHRRGQNPTHTLAGDRAISNQFGAPLREPAPSFAGDQASTLGSSTRSSTTDPVEVDTPATLSAYLVGTAGIATGSGSNFELVHNVFTLFGELHGPSPPDFIELPSFTVLPEALRHKALYVTHKGSVDGSDVSGRGAEDFWRTYDEGSLQKRTWGDLKWHDARY